MKSSGQRASWICPPAPRTTSCMLPGSSRSRRNRTSSRSMGRREARRRSRVRWRASDVEVLAMRRQASTEAVRPRARRPISVAALSNLGSLSRCASGGRPVPSQRFPFGAMETATSGRNTASRPPGEEGEPCTCSDACVGFDCSAWPRAWRPGCPLRARRRRDRSREQTRSPSGTRMPARPRSRRVPRWPSRRWRHACTQ